MDIRIILFVFSFIYLIFALPVKEEPKKQSEDHENKEEEKIDKEIDDLGLEYGRYLQQVVEALEQDKEFAKKLENVSQEEIKNGVIAKELDFVHHSVRNKLDELKRIELDRLRQLARKEKQLQDGMPSDSDGRRWRTLGADSSAVSLDAEHLDHANPHSFEAEDLQKLILSATKDLEALDAKRKEDFKTYEMEKELRYREALLNMTEEERQKTIAKHDQQQEQHKQHPKVHHPGSKKQLEQVWEEQDHMPREEFNPKVFFTLHDVNGDGFLDPQEVEAILSVEIKKMYSDKNPEDDPNEMQEEYHRMREHIYKEADVNRDGLISKKEFLDFTHRMEFERDEGWKGLDEEQVYSEEDLKKFQQQRQQYEQRQQYAAYQQFQPQYYPEGYHPQQYDGQNYGQQPHHYIPPPHQLTPEQWAQQQQYYGYQQVPQQQMHPNQQQYLQQPNPQLHPQQQQQLLLQQQQALHQQQQQQALHQQQQQAVPQIQQQVPQQQMGGQPQQHLGGGVPQQQHLNAVPQQQQQMGGVPQQQQQQQQPAHLSGAPVPQSGQQSPPLPRH